MLPSKFRLSVEDDIEGLLRKGRRLQTPFFVIRYRSTNLEKPRCAILASGKIAPKAVERNRIRRLLYNGIYDYIKKNSLNGIDCMILPMKKALITEPLLLLNTLHKALSLLKK